MDRSRKRSHYYDHQDYETFEALGRTKPRYHHNTHGGGHHYNRRGGGGGGSRSGKVQQDPPPPPPPSSSATVNTSYKILCRDDKAGGVIGKSGSIIKAIRQHTGAWINVQELVPGDDERVIEITDTRRRDPEGRMPAFSPAQEALLMIHERVLESDSEFVIGSAAGGSGDDDYPPPGPSSRGGGGGGGGSRVATRLVVSRMHVGSLLGKGGKIIEQMRGETKTQIRVLPRDHNLPRCVASSEEIVQVMGDATAVKKAVDIISSRLRESQHRDRGHFHSRLQSSDQSFSPDDDFPPHLMNNTSRRSTNEGPSFGSQLSSGLTNMKSNDYASRSSGYALESRATPGADGVQPFYGDDLVFRILCPYEKVHSVIGDPDGIADLLRNEIGVDVHLENISPSSNEQIIVISSEEGPDDELFPAQEALLHIQTRIVDLIPDGENIVTTRLLVSSSEVGCLEGRWLSDMKRLTGANILILTREEVPGCVTRTDEIVQITGEIKAARDALVEVTSRLRSHLYRELFSKETLLGSQGNTLGVEINYPNKVTPASEVYSGRDPPTATHHNVAPHPLKDSGSSGGIAAKQKDSERREEDVPSGLSRQISVPLVTRSILEVIIPENAVPKLITKSKNRLIQFSELSGANVVLLENRPDVSEKIIQMSGTPEQAEKAQSLLQGFILSLQEDGL